MLRDDQEAADATQDVFVKLFESRKRLNDKFPSSLLYRMATNICLNRLRDRRRKPETANEELLLSPLRTRSRRLLKPALYSRGSSAVSPSRRGQSLPFTTLTA